MEPGPSNHQAEFVNPTASIVQVVLLVKTKLFIIAKRSSKFTRAFNSLFPRVYFI
jgi:hypothetical protein